MNTTLRLGLLLGAVAAAQLAGGHDANAQSLLIDFGTDTTYRGISVVNPDSNGNHWNNIATGVFYTDLIDNSGGATTIDLGFSTPVGTDSYNGPAGDTAAGVAATIGATDIDAAALGDLGNVNAAYDFFAETNARFEIQGLDPAKTYNLSFYGSHKFNPDATTVYSVYSDNTYSTLVASTALDVYEPGSPWLHNRDTVATLTGVAPQASDILYVQFTGAGGDFGYLNAMQITAVPEPTSALLVASVVGLAVARRRTR